MQELADRIEILAGDRAALTHRSLEGHLGIVYKEKTSRHSVPRHEHQGETRKATEGGSLRTKQIKYLKRMGIISFLIATGGQSELRVRDDQ